MAYDIVEVPAETPVATPVALTVATPVETLVQVPPGTASLRDVENVLHTCKVPEIGPGAVLTVTVAVDAQPSASV
jgi:hypothetical protein